MMPRRRLWTAEHARLGGPHEQNPSRWDDTHHRTILTGTGGLWREVTEKNLLTKCSTSIDEDG